MSGGGGTAGVSEYPLGSDARELERLDLQGRLLAPATRTILESAGLGPGMRVLDLGSGAGDVAFVVADLVGSSGEVIGVERSPDSCAKASWRAEQRGLRNVRFVEGDIQADAPAHDLDAIVCRLVLMYVPDPAAVLRRHAATLRRGGLVVPIELDLATARSVPETPLVAQAISWMTDTFSRTGVHTSLGPRLWEVERDAGLQPRGMLGVQPYFGPHDREGMALLAGVVRAALPFIERAGVTSAAEIRIDSLHDRLCDELSASGAVFAHPALVSAWATAE